jgi:hypothetical protein
LSGSSFGPAADATLPVVAHVGQEGSAPIQVVSQDASQGDSSEQQGPGIAVRNGTPDEVHGQDLAGLIHTTQSKDQPDDSSEKDSGGGSGWGIPSSANQDGGSGKGATEGEDKEDKKPVAQPAGDGSAARPPSRAEDASASSPPHRETATPTSAVATPTTADPAASSSTSPTPTTQAVLTAPAATQAAPVNAAPTTVGQTETVESASTPSPSLVVARGIPGAVEASVRPTASEASAPTQPVASALAAGDVNALALLQVTEHEHGPGAPTTDAAGLLRAAALTSTPGLGSATTRLVNPATLWSGSAGQLTGAEGQRVGRQDAVVVPPGPRAAQQPEAGPTTRRQADPEPGASDEAMPVKGVLLRAPDAQGVALADAPTPDVADLGQGLGNFLSSLAGLFDGLPRLRGALVFLPVVGAVSAALLYGTVGRRRRKAPLPGTIGLPGQSDGEGSTETWLPSTSGLPGEDLS